jgi:hypothetical protein
MYRFPTMYQKNNVYDIKIHPGIEMAGLQYCSMG